MAVIINNNSSNASYSPIVKTADSSGVLVFQTNGSNAITIGTDQNVTINGTAYWAAPNGTTAQRPTPVNGMIRFNTTTNKMEAYANSTWANLST